MGFHSWANNRESAGKGAETAMGFFTFPRNLPGKVLFKGNHVLGWTSHSPKMQGVFRHLGEYHCTPGERAWEVFSRDGRKSRQGNDSLAILFVFRPEGVKRSESGFWGKGREYHKHIFHPGERVFPMTGNMGWENHFDKSGRMGKSDLAMVDILPANRSMWK